MTQRAANYKAADKKHDEDMAKLKAFAENKFSDYAAIYAKAKELENAEPNVAADLA